MKFPIYVALQLSLAGMANAQAAPEHHPWQDSRSFEPYSRTASAITGPISLTGSRGFASTGTKMTVTFGNGKKAELTAVGAAYREWGDSSDLSTGEIFRLDKDPGKLEQGNELCGFGPATYMVFYDNRSPLSPSGLLGMNVYTGNKTPKDINSPGLCGTFNFSLD